MEAQCLVFSWSSDTNQLQQCELRTKLGENKTTSSFTSGVVRNAPLPGPPVGPDPAAVQAYKRKMGLVQRAPLHFGGQITLLSLPTAAEHYKLATRARHIYVRYTFRLDSSISQVPFKVAKAPGLVQGTRKMSGKCGRVNVVNGF